MKKNIFRRAISIFLVMLLFATVLLPVASASNWREPRSNIPFEDVQRGGWEHDTISWAWVNRITVGRTQTTFAPNAHVTRAEFVAFLHRIHGGERPSDGTPQVFNDVRRGDVFWNPIMWAHGRGIVVGPPYRTRFFPNQHITREEIVVMLQRAQEGATPPSYRAYSCI